jgi:hypothetical protein
MTNDGGHPPLLDDDRLEQLAQRVAQLVAAQLQPPEPDPPVAPALLSAAQVSAWWGVDRNWVYDHADDLGVIRLGNGKRPRLRFDPEHVQRALRKPSGNEANPTGSPMNKEKSPRLLPIRGGQSYGR